MPSLTLPPDNVVNIIHGPFTRVRSRVEVYEADNTTLWKTSDELGLIDGNVTVDSTSTERRKFQLVIDNSDFDIDTSPDGLWYDKVIKLYRGVEISPGNLWERQLGEFLIDTLDSESFPDEIALNGRDFSKKLINDKFSVATAFAANTPIEDILNTIASVGGITKRNIPYTGKSTGKIYTFDRMTSRWDAIHQICVDNGLEEYFSWDGYLTVGEPADPYLDMAQYTFQTGTSGNLVNIKKGLKDDRLYNSVVITGESSDANVIPVYAIAENTEPTSPTRIEKIGRRSYFYTSSFITTAEQAQDVADKFLKVHALEAFEITLDSIVVPYMDAGITVNFYDPHPAEGDPSKYLLTSFTLPLKLGTMQAQGRRVTLVG